jgi:hypothetical protein
VNRTDAGFKQILLIPLEINIKQAISDDYDVPKANAIHTSGKDRSQPMAEHLLSFAKAMER